MASVAFIFPAPVANFLNLNVPGFASASGGGNTVVLQVPSSGLPAQVPAQVAAGLNDAGIQVSPPAADPAAQAAAVPVGARAGLAQFAPAGLVPQGAALENPDLAGANAAVQNLVQFGQAADAFFQQAAANPPPANLSELASWATAQQQAVLDWFGGGA